MKRQIYNTSELCVQDPGEIEGICGMEATLKKQKFSVQVMAFTALMAALLAVFSWISIPMPSSVPITLQAFGVALVGYVMGPFYGFISVLVWLLLGAVGVPVFAGFGSGVSSFVGYTGGFLWGFPFMAMLCGLGQKRPMWISVLLGLAGLLLINVLGAFQYMRVSGNTYWQSVIMVVAPYIVKDIICVVLVAILSRQINRALAPIRKQ